MATEEYSVGYNEGYQDGWNAALIPPKPWVELTDYDLNPLVEKCAKYYGYEMQPVQTAGFYRLADAISAKLKELNSPAQPVTQSDKPCECIDQFWCATFDRCKRGE